MLKRTRLMLDEIIDGANKESEINDETNKLVTFFNPSEFVGHRSAEIRFDKDFEDMCFLISKHLNADAKKFSVLQYYQALDYIKRDFDEQNKQVRNGRK